MRKMRFIFAILLALTLFAVGAAATPHASGIDCHYFSETGHVVCGEFLEFFNARGGLEIFGYPLTEAFHDPTHGDLYVQYFQRGRMEWHAQNADPYKVQLGLLADELGYRFPPVRPEQIPPSNNSLRHYFPETQHVVSYAFLDYFREHGGLDVFGYPRSEFMYEGGRVVQYFQRARLEWHPEGATGSQMRLANLGELYIERFGIPGDYDKPVEYSAISKDSVIDNFISDSGVTRLNVSASVRYAVTGRTGTQTVFVYVNDQRQRPVQAASVAIVVHYPSRDQDLKIQYTNESGFAKSSFEILPTPPGKRVIIDVTVTSDAITDLGGTTQTFFLPWW